MEGIRLFLTYSDGEAVFINIYVLVIYKYFLDGMRVAYMISTQNGETYE
jgi:hypothetical protein